MDEYSPIPLRKIDGDVDVGRNVAIGGDAIVQGKSHYKGDVRIDGWLDAENIKGPNKGLFTTLEGLKRAYPHPKDGWWAVVSKTLPGPIYVGDKGQWIRAGGETSTDVRLVSVDKTRRADEAEHAKTADVANYANEAGKLSDDSDLINRFVSKEHDDTVKGVITFLKGIIAKAVSYFQGIVNRGDINNNGDITNKGNISNAGDIMNSGNIMTNNLTVTGKATFFELEIQKAKAAGGMSVNSAGSFHIDAVEDTPEGFVCYQRAEKDGVTLLQTCEVNDQMMCSNGMNSLPLQGRGDQTNDGKPHAIGNHYYWRLVTDAPTQVVTHTIDGKEEKCLKLVLSKTDRQKAKNESPQDIGDIPKVGDDLVQIGNRDNKERQSVMMSCAYNSFDPELKPSYWAHYMGVNDYDISKHRYTWFAANGSQVTGNFKVQSDNGGLESIEDYVRGLASKNSNNTVVWHVAFSIRNITGKKGETFKIKYGRTVGESTIWYIYGPSRFGFDQLYVVIIDGATGNERQAVLAKDLNVADFYTGGSLTVHLKNNKTGEILAQDTIYPEAKSGKDAVNYKLLPLSENALAYFTKEEEKNTENAGKKKEKEKKIDIRLLYKIMKSAGEQVTFTTLEAEGMTLTIQPSVNKSETFNYDYKIDAYSLLDSIGYVEIPDNSYTVTLKKGSDIVDQRIVPITFKPKVVFDIDTVNGSLTSEIKTVKGQMSKIEQTAEHISLKVDGGIRPNLLWGSDLDLSGVQDVMEKAYDLGNSIKEKTEAKAEWKRKRDQADSDDDRMRYQEGMDGCDRKIAQAQGEVAKCREAIGKHLGVVISGDMEIGNKEMFEFQKGKGVNCSDAIRFKNAYKRDDWAKWTNISWHDVPLKPNTKYTISVWVKFKSYGKKGRMYVDCNSDDGRYCFGGFLYKEHYYSRESIDEWQRVRYVFDSGASKKMSALNFCCIADEEEGAQCEIWLCHPKLEEGNTATPWCAYDGTVDALLESGLDIKNRKMIATTDNFVVQNNKGEQTFMVDENGKINHGILSLDGLDAKRAVIKRLRFQSDSVAPYFVTEESMKEFATYCSRSYAGYNNHLLFPFDVATFFVFLIKPKWLTNIDQGYNRDFSPRSRDIAVSKGMARSFQEDYFSFALELFWHNMVGKTVTITNATNENISFGVKLKTEVLDDMGKKVTQIGGRLDNLPNFPERCVELINLLPGQMASFKYTVFSGAPMNVSVREVHTKGFFLLQDLFDFSYYKKLFEVGYDTEQGFNIFDKKYIDLFNTDKEHVEPKGGFPKKKR